MKMAEIEQIRTMITAVSAFTAAEVFFALLVLGKNRDVQRCFHT